MRIEHIAIWVRDIEAMRDFYMKYFGLRSNKKYSNEAKGFCSYFLSFPSGARLEIMQKLGVKDAQKDPLCNYQGYTHLAISVGSQEHVDSLTFRLQADGYQVLEGPRTTGDGYYESVILDPENNKVEITI